MIFEDVFDDNSKFEHSFGEPDFSQKKYVVRTCHLKDFNLVGRIVRNGDAKVGHRTSKNDKILKILKIFKNVQKVFLMIKCDLLNT